MKVGIIGYGKMGEVRHNALRTTGVGDVVAVYGFEYDTPPADLSVETPQDILNNPDIDAVYICCINSMNQDMTIAALNAGKHVFCEKPPAFNAAGVELIRTAEAKAAKVLMYGFNHRHHGAAVKMKEVVEAGEHGRILWMRGRYGKSVDEGYLDTWRAKPELAGGGIMLDQGIHMLDLFLHLAGEFDEVQAMVQHLYWDLPGIEDNVFANLRNSKTGCSASLHSTMIQWRHLFALEVFMERGYMVLNGLKTGSGTYGEEELVIARNRDQAPAASWEQEERHVWDVDESWEREARAFAAAVGDGKAPAGQGDSQSALDVMRLVDRIYASDRHHAPQLYSRLNAQ